MNEYEIPVVPKPPKAGKNQVLLVANGDLRLSANQKCWPEQAKMEEALGRRRRRLSATSWSAPTPTSGAEGHGFIALAEGRDGGLRRHRPQGAADRGRGGLAILATTCCTA